MFKLDVNQTFKWPIRVKIPAGSEGGFVEQTFTAEFRRVSRTRIAELRKVDIQSIINSDQQQAVSDPLTDLLEEVLIGVEGVKISAGGEPIEDAETIRRLLIQDPACSAAMGIAWNDAVSGGLTRKNW
jgi:hypothetical protein